MKRILENLVRKLFVNEISEGNILIIWKDVDGEVSGWEMSADDNNKNLEIIPYFIRDKKERKLHKMIGATGRKSDDTPPSVFTWELK